MEVRLQALDGQVIPQDLYLSLRVGGVQKQAKLAPSRTFHFPEQRDTKSAGVGRIEVYKRIGVCNVSLAGLDHVATEVPIELSDDDLPLLGLRMEIVVEGREAVTDKARERSRKKKERLDEAQKYVADHNLEELLAASLRDMMRAQPADPASFLSGQILTKRPVLPPLTSVPRPPVTPLVVPRDMQVPACTPATASAQPPPPQEAATLPGPSAAPDPQAVPQPHAADGAPEASGPLPLGAPLAADLGLTGGGTREQTPPLASAAFSQSAPTLGGRADSEYIRDLKSKISAKEAHLRALAAQLQELARLAA